MARPPRMDDKKPFQAILHGKKQKHPPTPKFMAREKAATENQAEFQAVMSGRLASLEDAVTDPLLVLTHTMTKDEIVSRLKLLRTLAREKHQIKNRPALPVVT